MDEYKQPQETAYDSIAAETTPNADACAIEPRKFTWQPKFSIAAMKLESMDETKELITALALYGTFGILPSENCPIYVRACFAGFKEDIDCSVNARYKNKGGRPKKSGGEPSEERQAIEHPRCPDCGGELLTKSQCLSSGMKNRGECGKLYCIECGQLFDARE